MHRPDRSTSYQQAVNGKDIKPIDHSDDDETPPPLALWDRCQHIRSLIKDLHQDMEGADEKQLKDVATELQIDMPTSERLPLIERIHTELNMYFTEPAECTPSTSRSDSVVSEIATKKGEPLVDFKNPSILVVKEQFIRFINKAGNEKCPKKGYPGPTKAILKQIHNLFNEEYFRKESEYIISNPLTLEWHFADDFIIMAAVKYQYHIVWDTKDGMTDTMIHWQMPINVTPQLRKESVQVVLYRHLRRLPDDLAASDLCPPIYARLKREGSAVAWQKTVYDPEKQDFFTKPCTFPTWITDDDLEVKLVRKMRNKRIGIETFFFKAALDSFDLGEHLHATNTLYYFVIHDKEIADFQEKVRPIEELHPTQAYVGRCPGTVLDRWIKRTSSHCQVAARLCHYIKSQQEIPDPFVPGTHSFNASLLECYLALAKVLRYKCALFVLYNLNSESDLNTTAKDLICHHDTTNMNRGLNEDKS